MLNTSLESVERTREHFEEKSALASFQTGYYEVSQDLGDIDEQFSKLKQFRCGKHMELTSSFESESFDQFVKGKPLGSATLSHRMEFFEKTINDEERAFQRQLDEYVAVEAELDSLAAELGESDQSKILDEAVNQCVGASGSELHGEMKEEKARLLDLFEKQGKESMAAMEASEKVADQHSYPNDLMLIAVIGAGSPTEKGAGCSPCELEGRLLSSTRKLEKV